MKSAYLSKAIEAAEAAQEVIRHYYRGDQLNTQLKEDQSPVTVADVETEKAIKEVLLGAFPDHGTFGEETGKDNPDAEFTWLIDPIDGTKSFVRQYPLFSTQIALMQGDEIILGVSNSPIYAELAYAEKGKGAFMNDEPIKVSGEEEMAQAILSMGNIQNLAANETAWKQMAGIICSVNRTRGYGDYYHYHLLASGSIDIVLESEVNILDIAPASIIIQEAGGVFTDLAGKPVGLDTTSVLAASSQSLYKAIDDRLICCRD